MNEEDITVGGEEGITVQIDESKFGKHKKTKMEGVIALRGLGCSAVLKRVVALGKTISISVWWLRTGQQLLCYH